MTQAETNKVAKVSSERQPRQPRRPQIVRDPAPRDAALQGLQSLLSVEHMSAHMATHLGLPVESFTSFEITYVRYKPGTNCLVAYRISLDNDSPDILSYAKVYTEKDFSSARKKEDAHRWVQGPGLPSSLVLNKERSIVYFFPNYCLLEGLRILSDKKKLQRLLYDWHDSYPESEWRISDRRMKVTPVRYKPERRAVLRCETRATQRETGKKEPVTVYVRIYSDERGEGNFNLMKTLYKQAADSGQLRLPRPLGYLPSRSLLMMEGLPGAPFKDALVAPNNQGLYSRLGLALGVFHTLKAPELTIRSVQEVADETFSSAGSLAKLVPELAESIWAVRTRLTELTPIEPDDSIGLVHGDFHLGQAVVSDTKVGIIDFDRSTVGDQYADLGELCAHLRLPQIAADNSTYADQEDEFLRGYEKVCGIALDKSRLMYWTTLRMLSLAISPFRRLEQHWRATARGIVEECHKLLEEK